MTHTPRRFARVAVTTAATLALATVATAATVAPTSAATTQPVTVVTSVDGVVDGTTYTSRRTSVNLAVRNGSTTGASLGAFSVVLPAGVTGIQRGSAAGASAWSETLLPCGRTANCSAILLVAARLPLSASVARPGSTVNASFSFVAPATAGVLPLRLIGIGGGIFTVSGPTPSVRVLDGTAASLGLSVAQPVVAGDPTSIVVTALNAGGQPAPFVGSTLTLVPSTADALATIDGAAPVGGSWTVPAPAGASSVTVSGVFTVAGPQSLQATSGSLTSPVAPFDVAAAAPDSLEITSLADTSQAPPLPVPASGQTFGVGFTVHDRFGNVATAPVTASLTALNPAGGGALTAADVTTAGGTGSFEATYSVPQTGLQLQVGSGALTPAVATTDVVIAGDSFAGGPDIAASLAAGGAGAVLGAGSYGPVFLTTEPCADEACTQGTEITLDGVFSDPDPEAGTEPRHLYSFAAPASVSWTCAAADCIHGPLNPYTGTRTPESEPAGRNYLYNRGSISDLNEQEQVEDFRWFPIQVSLKINGEYQPFAQAPACSAFVSNPASIKTGVIDSAAAKAAGFCVDVYAISRAGNSFAGALTLPVLFVEDPKLRP